MNVDFWDYIVKCGVCVIYQKDQQKELFILYKILNCLWEIVGCDIFYFEDRDYFCIVDYYFSYFEIN